MIAERLLYFQNIESLYKKKKKKVPASLSSRWENSHRDDKLKKKLSLSKQRTPFSFKDSFKAFPFENFKRVFPFCIPCHKITKTEKETEQKKTWNKQTNNDKRKKAEQNKNQHRKKKSLKAILSPDAYGNLKR